MQNLSVTELIKDNSSIKSEIKKAGKYFQK